MGATKRCSSCLSWCRARVVCRYRIPATRRSLGTLTARQSSPNAGPSPSPATRVADLFLKKAYSWLCSSLVHSETSRMHFLFVFILSKYPSLHLLDALLFLSLARFPIAASWAPAPTLSSLSRPFIRHSPVLFVPFFALAVSLRSSLRALRTWDARGRVPLRKALTAHRVPA